MIQRFLLLTLALFLTAMAPQPPAPVPPLPPGIQAERSIWLSFPYWNLTWTKKQTLVAYLASKGINKVYLSVYDSGTARWESSILPASGTASAGSDADLMDSVRLFRSHGIFVSAFFEGGLSVFLEKPLVRQHPEWLQKCDTGVNSGEHEGHLMAFFDPLHPQARRIVLGALAELARHPAGFMEIQLDRMRYTRGSDWSLCLSGNGESKPTHVNGLVREAYRTIKSIRPDIRVTASPVGSYGRWKLNQSWGEWVAGGYIDGIASQAYIPADDLSECARGHARTHLRERNLAVFKGELASLMGRPNLLEEAVTELAQLGGEDGLLELKERRPMVQARARELGAAPRLVPISIGVMAHQFDDSECVLDQMILARRLGFHDATLWVSEVAPSNNGKPFPGIDDNLTLLRETLWAPERRLVP